MNWCRDTAKMEVPAANRPAVAPYRFRGVPHRYVGGATTRGLPAFGSERRTAGPVVPASASRNIRGKRDASVVSQKFIDNMIRLKLGGVW
jgi:hypothetical protein